MVDDEFEGNGRQEKNEGQLKSILGQVRLHGERSERHATDEELKTEKITCQSYVVGPLKAAKNIRKR